MNWALWLLQTLLITEAAAAGVVFLAAIRHDLAALNRRLSCVGWWFYRRAMRRAAWYQWLDQLAADPPRSHSHGLCQAIQSDPVHYPWRIGD